MDAAYADAADFQTEFLLVKPRPSHYFAAMKCCIRCWLALGIVFYAVEFSSAFAQAADAVATAPAYVPDVTHQNDPLPDGVLAWEGLLKATDTTNGQEFARFEFGFTNVFQAIHVSTVTNRITFTNVVSVTNIISVTNTSYLFFKKIMPAEQVTAVENYTYTTNFILTTNATAQPVTILDVHPSCGCTTVELPSRPWTIPPGVSGQIKLAVNLAGKAGVVIKSATVTTDQGRKDLTLRITIAPPPAARLMSDGERAAAMTAAKMDRQAVFKGDCASCHAPKSPGLAADELYKSICAICHEAEHRASVVPDLHAIKVPTNPEFWKTWIYGGKPGSLMPAFAQAQGGPLSEMQIAALANYLNAVFPSHATNNVGP
jgi:mono/diheme cytochrome c family protein